MDGDALYAEGYIHLFDIRSKTIHGEAKKNVRGRWMDLMGI